MWDDRQKKEKKEKPQLRHTGRQLSFFSVSTSHTLDLLLAPLLVFISAQSSPSQFFLRHFLIATTMTIQKRSVIIIGGGISGLGAGESLHLEN